MDSVKQQIIERIKQGTNVLVTVSNNPSVDQLASCIALTIMLNKLGKHATAVYSGETPSTMEFLQPEKTLEKNTDSLRDFIIAIDKSKADKLRYKVEDKLVKIFITPYKTSISEKDLVFSEGDFNVDVIIALGVHNQGELDQAIAAHGRILHDATVISINDAANGTLGSLNLVDQSTSSLSELVTEFDGVIGKTVLDAQIATALLTGIVSETKRFSNEKTSSITMSVSSKLLAAGADQQLVAVKMEEYRAPTPTPPPPPKPTAPPKEATRSYGAIQIRHEAKKPAEELPKENVKEEVDTEIKIDSDGTLRNNLSDDESFIENPANVTPAIVAPNVGLAPLTPTDTSEIGDARGAVESAIDSVPPATLPPIEALNAQSVFSAQGGLFGSQDNDSDEEKPSGEPSFGTPQLFSQQKNSVNPSTGANSAPMLQDHPQNTLDMPLPTSPFPSIQPLPGASASESSEQSDQPPPVPPPIMPFSPGIL